jgi:cytochrome c-type biogenesis protein CcmH
MNAARALTIFAATVLFAALSFAAPTFAAIDPHEALPDAIQETRARALFKELRCVVCQSESLDDSQADLARDMRKLVREQIATGQSDDAIKAYFTARYGDFVLLKPPVAPYTWAVWFGPFALLLLGLSVWAVVVRRNRAFHDESLSDEEQREIESEKSEGSPPSPASRVLPP